jgi:hypothetical protein
MAQRSNPALSKPVEQNSLHKTAYLIRNRAQRIPSWPGGTSPTKAEYICADQPATFTFRLQNGGGPYICSGAHSNASCRVLADIIAHNYFAGSFSNELQFIFRIMVPACGGSGVIVLAPAHPTARSGQHNLSRSDPACKPSRYDDFSGFQYWWPIHDGMSHDDGRFLPCKESDCGYASEI